MKGKKKFQQDCHIKLAMSTLLVILDVLCLVGFRLSSYEWRYSLIRYCFNTSAGNVFFKIKFVHFLFLCCFIVFDL